MKKRSIKEIINILLIVLVVLLTFYRVYLACKIPLYAQAGADLDDFLMVKYAVKMINFKWLGAFDSLVLAKASSFSLFLAIGYWLNISYSLLLILCYILAIILLTLAIKKLISNKYFLGMVYLFLIYSPVMFHIENFQKIYRGGTIITFALMVIASCIGVYTRRNEKIKNLTIWSAILSLSLGFFWFIKEDSIWILPFVIGGLSLAIIWIIINRKNVIKYKIRVLIILYPLISLFLINVIYKGINYTLYGEYTITDRTGTYYKEVLNDLLMIKNKRVDEVWITKDTVYKAMEVSPTLKSIKPQIDEMYKSSWALVNGEIRGDIFFWTFRSAVNDAGKYKDGGKKVNQFYKKIDKELDNAFEKGKLKKEKALYLSSVSKGITKNDIKYFKENTSDLFKVLITYSENEVGYYEATGPYKDIIIMQQVTNSKFAWPNTESTSLSFDFKKADENNINHANDIVNIYQKTGMICFISGLIGISLLMIQTIKDLFNKKYGCVSISFIILGLILSCAILFVGVEWFVSWFGFTKYRYMYNYACGIIPLIQIIELIGMYYLFKFIFEIFKNMGTQFFEKNRIM